MTILKILLVAAAGYVLGSLSFSVLFSRLFLGKDIRSEGSGNAGATNMARVFGAGAGVATFLFDFCKCLAAMLIGRALLGDLGVCLGGVACLMGHCYPVFHHFKGGKGVSCGAAVALMFGWKIFAVAILVFLILALLSRKVSLGSILAACVPIVSIIFLPRSLPMILLAAIACVIIVTRHHENIKRLLAGTESDFRFGSKKK